MKKKLLLLLCTLVLPIALVGQNVAIKTNLLHWATVSPNLAVEIGLGKKVTLDLYGAYMPFEITPNNSKWKHWLAQPELRLWTCEKFNGFFFGIHAMGGGFNWGNLNFPPVAYTFERNLIPALKDHRYEGYFAGAGISIGYQWILGNRWNLELSVGGGYNHIWYKEFGAEKCAPLTVEGRSNYIGPTKATLSIIFFFD